MEQETKPFVAGSKDFPAKSSDSEAIEARFTDLCKNALSLEEKDFAEAKKLFIETKHILSSNVSAIGNGTLEEAEQYWFAFVLYSVKRLSEKSGDSVQERTNVSRFTLCQILRAAKLNIVDFFKELPHFVVKLGPVLSKMYGEDWENRLEAKELQADFVHLSLLSKFWVRDDQKSVCASEMLLKPIHKGIISLLFDGLYSGIVVPVKSNDVDPGVRMLECWSYKRAFGELFVQNGNKLENYSVAAASSDHLPEFHRFGWLLFLALRVHVFSRFKDLVTCTNGFVSILAILIVHVPVCFRNFNICDDSRFVKKGDKGVDLLASLCNMYDASEDDLRKTMDKANDLIADILKKKPRLASDCKAETLENINTDGLTYFEDLLEGSSLSSSLSLLEKDYDDAIHNKGELDERVFINEEESLLGSGSLSGGSVNNTGVKRKFDSIASPAKSISSPLSPHRSPSRSHANGIPGPPNLKMAATPVSTAMTTAKWLRTAIAPLPSRPSAKLQRFLTSCDRDVTNDVVRRAHIILEAIFPNSPIGERCITGNLQSANLMDNIWTEQRRLEALKLYYKVLEAMCEAESQILHANNLTSLLSNERFHRCMLACSAELVLATHKTATMLFPAVLERTGITAFDLSKVIESFIRHEESLPRELRRHLNSLEERLLESLVWEKGSSLYNSLVVARPSLVTEIDRLGLLAEPMPSLDAITLQINFNGGLPCIPSLQKHETSPGQNGDMRSPKRPCSDYRSVLVERNSFTSPVKDRLLSNLKSKAPLQSAFASPTRPNPGGGGETCAETGISVFFTKINKLAAVRINGMVERLQLSQQIRENVYCLFQQILNQQTSLFFNRHIDQIILCCFYGVAKISQLNLTFREIIYNYRKQPQCKPQIFRSVFVDWSSSRRNGRTGQDHIDIITFYNEIFIPTVKPLLVELGPSGAASKTNRNAETSNNANGLSGQCPGSPKVTSFPSLPDMSPKKVSATHNVYVSPLRSSKMDALISHSSKSYYACVGESTHAYQSPSKDLTAINNRLNSGARKVRGALNFDDVDVGLVSDSMVANSLHLQNGNPSSSTSTPVKPKESEH